jgi:hypothetical protein
MGQGILESIAVYLYVGDLISLFPKSKYAHLKIYTLIFHLRNLLRKSTDSPICRIDVDQMAFTLYIIHYEACHSYLLDSVESS